METLYPMSMFQRLATFLLPSNEALAESPSSTLPTQCAPADSASAASCTGEEYDDAYSGDMANSQRDVITSPIDESLDHILNDATTSKTITERHCSSSENVVGNQFYSLSEARRLCQDFAQCPLIQRSQKSQNFVTLACFRAGTYVKSESKVAAEFQKKKKTNKCGCQFL